MVWMEPAGLSGSVAPVFNDLDLKVVAYDGTSESTFYPNNLAAKDPDNTVEMVVIPDVDSYEWFNVRESIILLMVSLFQGCCSYSSSCCCCCVVAADVAAVARLVA